MQDKSPLGEPCRLSKNPLMKVIHTLAPEGHVKLFVDAQTALKLVNQSKSHEFGSLVRTPKKVVTLPHFNRPHFVGRMSNIRCHRLQAREAAPSLLLDVFEQPGITVRQGRLFRQVWEHRHRTPIFPQGCAAWLQRQQAHHGLQKYASGIS